MAKPAMPILVDGLAHAFWAHVHIATVHVHEGKQHVHYELRKMAMDDGPIKREGAINEDFSISPHIKPDVAAHCLPLVVYPVQQRYALYSCYYPSLNSTPDYPPPKA
jgi:hypothetical protein